MKAESIEKPQAKKVGIKLPFPPIFPLAPEVPPTFYQHVCLFLRKVKAAIQRSPNRNY